MNAATLSIRSVLAALVLSLFLTAPAMAKDADGLAQFAVAKIMQVTQRSGVIVQGQTNLGVARLEKADEKGAPDALLVRFAANSNHKVTMMSSKSARIVNAIGTKVVMKLRREGADPALIAMVEEARQQGLQAIQSNAQTGHDLIADALAAALASEGTPEV
ncbi:MAG: hypothetical protein KDA20_05635 [Phycisphaerales bacterium]|nr:hypothetical protein [Phycisphaerales bacterium]